MSGTRGRPAIGPRIEIRLDPDTLAELQQAADELGKSTSFLARAIIAGWLMNRSEQKAAGPVIEDHCSECGYYQSECECEEKAAGR